MCGITGLINLDGSSVSSVILKKMTDAIAHRGPDGEGQWIEGNIGLGHRRLAIIDLSPAGHQPMISADHRWVLSYNGEIYNYRELRAELEAEGVWFRSQTDSEVVLYALAHWGRNALLKFNGMFAIALWDRKEKTLMIARDRYGIKPLYYAQQGSHFAFGSEQKAIIAQPGFHKRLNKSALLEYFTFQNIFTDQTLLEDIQLLPAGHYATFNVQNLKFACHQYWDYRFREPEYPVDKQEYLEELDRLFKQAVNRQLVSDVELGAYLRVAWIPVPSLLSPPNNSRTSKALPLVLTLALPQVWSWPLMNAPRPSRCQLALKLNTMKWCSRLAIWNVALPSSPGT